MAARIQVLGLCRFSYAAEPKNFKAEHADEAALRAYLYDPVRLGLRCYWFEHILLPSLRAQTDPDFTLLLLMGEDFPDPFRARILAAIADLPQIVPLFRPPGNLRDVSAKVMIAARDPKADVVAEFRMDDDDAVASVFVARTRAMYPFVRRTYMQRTRVTLDFNRGIVVEATPRGVRYHPVLTQHWALAMPTYLHPADPKSSVTLTHRKIWENMCVLNEPSGVMYLRGLHGHNDSGTRPQKYTGWDLPARRVRPLLRNHFGIDKTAFESGLSALLPGPAAGAPGGC